MFRDKSNKKAHEESARVACEAASSIRTVVALTREDDFCEIYRRSLEGPLRNGTKAAIQGGILYGFSQGMMFWMIALVFWYGSLLLSKQEYGIVPFFVSLMVRLFLCSATCEGIDFIAPGCHVRLNPSGKRIRVHTRYCGSPEGCLRNNRFVGLRARNRCVLYLGQESRSNECHWKN
jgi:hypothetical protein